MFVLLSGRCAQALVPFPSQPHHRLQANQRKKAVLDFRGFAFAEDQQVREVTVTLQQKRFCPCLVDQWARLRLCRWPAGLFVWGRLPAAMCSETGAHLRPTLQAKEAEAREASLSKRKLTCC